MIEKELVDYGDKEKDSMSSLDEQIKEYLRNESSFLQRQDATLWQLSRPMPLTDMYVKKPCIMLNSAFVFLLLVFGIVAYFKIYEFHKLTHRDYLVWTDPKTWDWDKSNLVKEYLVVGSGDNKAPLQTQIESYWATFMIYHNRPEISNVWTKENLIAIRDLEKPIIEDKYFQETCYSVIKQEYDA